MLALSLEDARVGMKLAVSVAHPQQPEHDLLRAGYVLEDHVLNRLRDLGVSALYIDYPDLADLDEHFAVSLSPARQAIYQQMKSSIASVQRNSRPTANFTDYYSTTRGLIQTLLDTGRHPIYMDVLSTRMGADAIAHATAVAHLSLMLGLRLEEYLIDQRRRLSPQRAREVVNLGVGAMLHDLGKAKLPADLQRCTDARPPADPAQLAAWQTHPQVGYDMIKGGVESTAAAAVLHHHQHFDGSGFAPLKTTSGTTLRPSGQQIHIFARIIRAADLVDRLTLGEDGRPRPNVQVLHLLRTRYAAWLDPSVLSALEQVVPPFAPGTKVVLSDDTPAIVIGFDARHPYQPRVRRMSDQDLQLVGEPVDLATQPSLHIRRAAGLDVEAMIPPLARAA